MENDIDAPVTFEESPTILEGIGTKLVQVISQYEGLYLVVAMSVFLLADAYKACVAPLWFDELFTLFFSRIHSTSEMLKAICIDSQPPLQYLLTHPLLRWLGKSELVLRLPELLAYTAVGVLTYRIVRRRGTAVQALFALTMVMGAFVGEQAYTARPYGLLLAFTALTFASWQAAASKQTGRILPLLGVTLGVGGAILSHNLGIVHVAVFLAVGETTRLIQRRRLDGWMLAAIVAGLMALTITLPMARASQLPIEAIRHSANYFYKPKIGNLVTYLLMFPLPLGFLTLLGFLFWRGKKEAGDNAVSRRIVPGHEWAAASALSLLLPLLLVILAVSVGQYATRYAIGTSLGLAILGAWGLPQLGGQRTRSQLVLSCSTVSYLVLVAFNLLLVQVREPVWRSHPAEKAVSPLLRSARGDLPIVVASALDYAPEWWYSAADVKSRLIYLTDVPYAMQQGDFLPELSLVIDRAYTHLPTSDFAAFVKMHPQFLLLKIGEPHQDWISSRLVSAGLHLETIAKSGNDALFLVDRRQ